MYAFFQQRPNTPVPKKYHSNENIGARPKANQRVVSKANSQTRVKEAKAELWWKNLPRRLIEIRVNFERGRRPKPSSGREAVGRSGAKY